VSHRRQRYPGPGPGPQFYIAQTLEILKVWVVYKLYLL